MARLKNALWQASRCFKRQDKIIYRLRIDIGYEFIYYIQFDLNPLVCNSMFAYRNLMIHQ